MKPDLGILVASMLLTFNCTVMLAQEQPERANHPFAVKIGSEGLGLDISIPHAPLAVDATAYLFGATTKMRWLILSDDATPYVGFGSGFWGDPGGGRSQWSVVHAGWEVSGRHLLMQFFVQYPVFKLRSQKNVPYPFGFHVGYRF